MNVWQQLLIVFFSSGAFGVIISAISSRSNRKSRENIQGIVEENTKSITDSVQKMDSKIDHVKSGLEDVRIDMNTIKRDMTELKVHQEKQDARLFRIKAESEEMDRAIIQDLVAKGVFNGNTGELYNKMGKMSEQYYRTGVNE